MSEGVDWTSTSLICTEIATNRGHHLAGSPVLVDKEETQTNATQQYQFVASKACKKGTGTVQGTRVAHVGMTSKRLIQSTTRAIKNTRRDRLFRAMTENDSGLTMRHQPNNASYQDCTSCDNNQSTPAIEAARKN